MSDKEILTKAINLAIAGGYQVVAPGMEVKWIARQYTTSEDAYDLYSLIFNHDFAKAIAGDEWTKFLCDLVVEPDPIQELAKWL